MSSYILNFSPTGMVPTKQLNASTPISVSEIIEDVLMAADMGASIAHLHARDAKTGEPTCDLPTFAAIIEGIRQHEPQHAAGHEGLSPTTFVHHPAPVHRATQCQNQRPNAPGH